MEDVVSSLPVDVREALHSLAKARGITPEAALGDAVCRELSLDQIRAQGWRLLAEKDGDIRELAEA